MVFIDNQKKLIELLGECSRDEIATSLMAYEFLISNNNKVRNDDLKVLEKAFYYHNEKYSDNYPCLLNENLQDIETLVCESQKDFSDNNHLYTLELEDLGSDKIQFHLYVKEKRNGIFITGIPLSVKIEDIDNIKADDLDNDKNFIIVNKAMKHFKNKIMSKEIDIEKFLNKTLSI